MYFIVRSMFWIGIVVLLLPIGGDTQFRSEDAFEAAKSAVADLSGFCDRNPGTCETSATAVSALGHKMAESAKWAYAFATDRTYTPTERETDVRTVRTVPFTAPGVVARPEMASDLTLPSASAAAARNVTRVMPTNEPNTTVLQRGTLTAADQAPAWQGGQRI